MLSTHNIAPFFAIALLFAACETKPKNAESTDPKTDSKEDVKSDKKQDTKEEAVVNVYSHRHYDADKKLYKAFQDKTGIEVKVIKANADELIERIKTEGERSSADLFLAADVGRLVRAEKAGILQPIKSETLETKVPAHLRDPEGDWFGIAKRARVLVYDKSKGKPDLSTYEALADPKMKGKIVVRSGTNIYNQSLLASIIANSNKEEAAKWAKGVVANMARKPKGSDRDQMKAIAAGEGEVGIVNTYYVGLLVNSDVPAEQEVGKKMGVFFPNQDDRGTHVNVSGAGVVKNAPHKENAVKLLEFLVSPEAQKVFTDLNYEFPVVDGITPNELLKSWGTFKEDTLPLTKVGAHHNDAVKTFDVAGWR